MPRRVLAPIVTSKHYNQFSPTTVATGTIANLNQIEAVAVQDVSTLIEVEEGSIVKAIYAEFWITSDDATQSSFQLMIEKLPAGATDIIFAQANTLGGYVNKKNVFYVTRGLVPPSTGSPVAVVRGWFAIPKGKQRFGLGDKLEINISAIANGLTFCGFTTYKEYK